MCCRFSPLFMSKSPFFGQLPMAKLYAWKREAEGQTKPMCRHDLYLPRSDCSWGWRGSVFRGWCVSVSTVLSVDPHVTLAAALLELPTKSTLTLPCPT